MLASLPMYDLPEIRENTDGFWSSLSSALSMNIALTRGDDWSAPWRNPNLLFSQTCGYPFTHEFAGQLTYVATPHYDVDGCEGPTYSSIIFAREMADLAAFENCNAAYNSSDSMSGCLALKLVVADHHTAGSLAFFASGIKTGSHAASLSAVQQGLADICAIDCVTVALLRRHRPEILDNLVEVGRSPKVPSLPYVTRSGDIAHLQQALVKTVQMPQAKKDLRALAINGVSILHPQDYDVIVNLEKSISDKNIFPQTR